MTSIPRGLVTSTCRQSQTHGCPKAYEWLAEYCRAIVAPSSRYDNELASVTFWRQNVRCSAKVVACATMGLSCAAGRRPVRQRVVGDNKYARVGVKLCKGNRILIIIKIFGRHKLVPTLPTGKVWQIWWFSMFLSILLPLSQKLTPSLCTTSYVHESRRWQTFSLFALSELVCTKNVFTLFYYSLYFLTPSFFPFKPSQTDRRTDNILHSLLPKLFYPTERAGPYPQAQLYWAGRTMGWMADWTRRGQGTKVRKK